MTHPKTIKITASTRTAAHCPKWALLLRLPPLPSGKVVSDLFLARRNRQSL